MLPKDKIAHKIIMGGWKSILAYLPLLFAIAPFNHFTLGCLIVLATIAVVLKYARLIPFWISGIAAAGIMLSVQTYMLRDTDYRHYFVDCPKMTIECAQLQQLDVLDTPVRIWPFNSALPLLGSFKKTWFRRAVGSARFDGTFLRPASEQTDAGLLSPLERQLFTYFAGNRQLDGIRLPYRLLLSGVSVFSQISVKFAADGSGNLDAGIGGTINSGQELLRVPPIRTERDLAFTAVGNPNAKATWRRAVHNDLWLEALAVKPSSALVATIREDTTSRNRAEEILVNAIDLAAWCSGSIDIPAMIGCHARSSQMNDSLAKLEADITSRSGTISLIETIMENALADAHFDTPPPTFEGVSPTSVAAGLFGQRDANKRLADAVTKRFGTFIAKPQQTESKLCSQSILKEIFAADPLTISKLMAERSAELLGCETPRVLNHIDVLLSQSDEAFDRTLTASNGNTDPSAQRYRSLVMFLHIENQLADEARIDITSLFYRAIEYLNQRDALLYNPNFNQDIRLTIKEARATEELYKRRARVLQEFSDAPERIQRFLAGDQILVDRERENNRNILELLERFHQMLSAFQEAYPEGLGSLEADLDRFANAQPIDELLSHSIGVAGVFTKSYVEGFLAYRGADAVAVCQESISRLMEQVAQPQFLKQAAADISLDLVISAVGTLDGCGLGPTAAIATRISQELELDAETEVRNADPAERGEPNAVLALVSEFFIDPDTRVLPKINQLQPLTNRADPSGALYAHLLELYGNTALGLDSIDWASISAPDYLSMEYPFAAENITPDELARINSYVCGFWGDTSWINAWLANGSELWKQATLLLPLSNLERLCATADQGRLAEVVVHDMVGQEVLEAYRDSIVSPLRRELISKGTLSLVADAIRSGDASVAQRRLFAQLALFRETRQSAAQTKDSSEPPPFASAPAIFATMLMPWQQAELFEAPEGYLWSAEQLLSAEDPELRKAALALLERPDHYAEALPLTITRPDLKDEDARKTLLQFAKLLRPLNGGGARVLAEPLFGADSRLEERYLMIELLLDAGFLQSAASAVAEMDMKLLGPDLREALYERFWQGILDDEGEAPELVDRVIVNALSNLRNAGD